VTVALDTLAFAGGIILVILTVLSAVRATILPRGVPNRLSAAATGAVRTLFRLRARRSATYERRDRVMAMLAPISLLVVLATWLVLIFAGYTLMYLAVTSRSLRASLELSGSSIFTLGTTADSQLGPALLTYTEAGLGLLLVALLITFLPSIYGAFSRRENGVSLLQVRAGDPARAAAMLIRYQRIEESQYRLTELWRQWEAWFTDVEETHTTFPILVFFRSPQPERSWITSAGVLLDGASFWTAAIEHPKDPDAQLCIRAGFLCLRRIADVFKVTYPADPAAGDPISVSRQEWDDAMAEMNAAGVPLIADWDQAWEAWKGWRVNYDTLLLNLARLVEAPLTPWVSDRSPVPFIEAPRRRLSPRRVGGIADG
jgi:hypothetical protein